MNKDSKIYIAWHRGLVGSALLRILEEKEYTNLIFRTHSELDLTDPIAVRDFFQSEKPEYVFLAAARVWWVVANDTYPADFLLINLKIQNNIIENSYKFWVKKLLFLGSSCIYPKLSPQPIKEEYLLTGPLETTNDAYAIAKIAGIKLCQSYNRQYGTEFIACMPTNLYGPNDNFDLENSHVMPAMIRKFHEAKINNLPYVTLWWDGTPFREFLYVDDMAYACIHLMDIFSPTKEQNETGDIFVNIGTWQEIQISDLATLVASIVWYSWKISWDINRPNGTPRKLLDSTKVYSLWWKPQVELKAWIQRVYDYVKTYNIF
jgi:GDP-L-fucose synthase